jgi:hypothetical protein
VSAALSVAFCASAFAGIDNVGTQTQKQQTKKPEKICYVISSVSGVPQPCDRFSGPIPTTASPIEILR